MRAVRVFLDILENFSKDNIIRLVSTLQNILQAFYLVTASEINHQPNT